MKRLVDDPWKKVKDMYKVGQIVSGEVHKIEPFGLMVKLDNHIHGLAHISELSNKQISNVTELRTIFTIGESKDFEIINIEPAEHRLGLRLAGVKPKREEKKEDKPVSAKAAPDKTVSDEVVSDKKEEKVEEVVEEKVEKTEEKSA